MGNQNCPREGGPHGKRPLREAIQEAIDYYQDISPNCFRNCGREIMEVLFARFLIRDEYFEDISRNFQALVDHPGQFIAGDEKLFHFTGNTTYIRTVPSKPSHVGLWFFECCCLLHDNLIYLLDFQLSK